MTQNVWDAEDLLQDTLIRAFAGLAQIDDPVANLQAYLLRIATNLWIDQVRRLGIVQWSNVDPESLDEIAIALQTTRGGAKALLSRGRSNLARPVEFRFEAQRARLEHHDGEPIVLVFRTRKSVEALQTVIRLSQDDGRISELRAYSFCPELKREIAEYFQIEVRAGGYRYPTPVPGSRYMDAKG